MISSNSLREASVMQLKAAKTLPCISCHPLWLLGFAVAAFLIIGAWSRLSVLDAYSGTIDEHLIPTKVPLKGPGYPPVLAYCIFGSRGDGKRILRLLKSIYHPRNQYLLHLDASSSYYERMELLFSVQFQKEFQAFGNVHIVGKSNAVNQAGASSLAAVLHAAALLLRMNADWDWFTALSTSDYPLLTQDDILYALSSLSRNLNFIHYTNGTDGKKRQYSNEIVVDPSLYSKKNSPIFSAAETREEPDAFKVYGGSPWMILSRSFTEHCVNGLDNLPRKLLMYFSNVAFPLESYFHTVLCNTPEFQNTTVNSDLRYIIGQPGNSKGKPIDGNNSILVSPKYDEIVARPAAFARPFEEDDPLLEEIDREILKRPAGGVVPGNWCMEGGNNKKSGGDAGGGGSGRGESKYYCTIWDDIDSIKPGNFGKLLSEVIAGKRWGTDECHSFNIDA